MITPNDSRIGYDYRFVSTDTKPETGIEINSIGLELDTGKFYYFTGATGADAWKEIGWNA